MVNTGSDAGELEIEAGTVLASKYVLERPAGFGGMAELWVATNQSTGAEVCVKLLVPRANDGGEAVERFRREAYAAARLSHRAIVRVFDLLELDARGEATKARPHAYAIVMELLHGETLGEQIAKRGPIPLEEALDIFLPIASALAHAHRANVIHRDIKPDNVFLSRDPDGQLIPKVLDFGVSKLVNAEAITMEGAVVGTPCFMSPEQAKGARQVDARSDVFAAGILFYTMLTGSNPFEDAPTFASAVDAVLRRPVGPIAGLAPEIWAVIDRSIAKDPAARFADATELSIALRKACGRRGTTESNPVISVVGSSPTLDVVTSAELHEPDAPLSVDARIAPASARRRRAIVAAVVGAAAAVLVGALAETVHSRHSEATGVGPTNRAHADGQPEGPAEATSGPTIAEPASDASSPSRPSEVGSAAVEDRALRSPVSSPARSAPPKRAAAPSSSRRPGEEPKNARDPGF